MNQNDLLATAILLTLLYYLNLLIYRKKNLLHVPGPFLIPFLGNAILFAGDHLHFLPVMQKLRGKILKSQESNQNIVRSLREELQAPPWSATQPGGVLSVGLQECPGQQCPPGQGLRLPVPVAVAGPGSPHQWGRQVESQEEVVDPSLPWQYSQTVPRVHDFSRRETFHQAGQPRGDRPRM